MLPIICVIKENFARYTWLFVLLGEAGETVTKETTEAAAREGAQAAGREAAQAGAREAAQAGARESAQAGAREAALAASRESAQAGAREAAQAGARESAQAGARESAQAGARESAQVAAREGAQFAARETVQQAGKQTTSSVYKKAAIAAGLAGIGYLAWDAYDDYNRKNGKKFKIISIKKSGNNLVIIELSEGEEISINDKVSITNTNCDPKLEGEYFINKVISQKTLEIQTSFNLQTEGNQGDLTLLTTFESQLAQNLLDVVETPAGILGDIGNELLAPIHDIFKGLIPEFKTFQIVSIICCVVIIVICILFIIWKTS